MCFLCVHALPEISSFTWFDTLTPKTLFHVKVNLISSQLKENHKEDLPMFPETEKQGRFEHLSLALSHNHFWHFLCNSVRRYLHRLFLHLFDSSRLHCDSRHPDTFVSFLLHAVFVQLCTAGGGSLQTIFTFFLFSILH